MKDRIMTFGFAALAAVATAGWMRQPVQLHPADLASNFAAPQGIQALPVTNAANTFAATETPVAVPAPNTTSRPRVIRQAAASEPVYRPVAHNSQPRMRTRDEQVARDSDSYGYRDDRSYEGPRRSTAKSAAIIAGGAATGAAIGGMAGGGKGAAIGAIVGGIGGAVYDRSTYKKTDGWGWKRDIQ